MCMYFVRIKYVREEQAKDTFKSKQKLNQPIINKKKSQFSIIKKFHFSLGMTSSLYLENLCSKLSKEQGARDARVV